MKINTLLGLGLLSLSLNSFAAERPDCQARFASTTARVSLKIGNSGTFVASYAGYDFEAFIDGNSLYMNITKPVDSSGERESISTGQSKPSIKYGTVNMFLSNSQEQITLLCRVVKQ